MIAAIALVFGVRFMGPLVAVACTTCALSTKHFAALVLMSAVVALLVELLRVQVDPTADFSVFAVALSFPFYLVGTVSAHVVRNQFERGKAW